jgi:PilZ domain-containing protein
MAETSPQSSDPQETRKPASSGAYSKSTRQELRRYLRFRIEDASAELIIKGFFTSFGLGRVNKGRAAINLSEGGVMLLVRETIPVDTKVTVRIDMEKYEDVIEASGVVKWCEQSARSDKDFYAGIEFTGLGDADLKKIAKMREWFTSPEFKTRTATRRRTQPPRIQTDA